METNWTVHLCDTCGEVFAEPTYCDGSGGDSEPHGEGLTRPVPVVPLEQLRDSIDINKAVRDGIFDALKTAKQELRNVRAGVWAALAYLDRKEQGMAEMQLRGCLPPNYAPVGMGGDPDVAASIVTNP